MPFTKLNSWYPYNNLMKKVLLLSPCSTMSGLMMRPLRSRSALILYCYVTNNHKFSGLKQHTYLLSPSVCGSRVLAQLSRGLSFRVLPGCTAGTGFFRISKGEFL